MLSKKYRLPGHLIPHLINSPNSFSSPFLNLKTSENQSRDLRFGFIVSTKIAKNAVDRNKIKRLLRESIKPYFSKLQSGHDLLFFAKHPIKNKTLDQLKPHLSSLLKQSKLLKK
ncbi:ribonuclease P protein component [Patescibacteria group bacterium]